MAFRQESALFEGKMGAWNSVPQLDQNINLLLSNLQGTFEIFGGVEDLTLLGSSPDAEDTAESPTSDLSFLFVLEI